MNDNELLLKARDYALTHKLEFPVTYWADIIPLLVDFYNKSIKCEKVANSDLIKSDNVIIPNVQTATIECLGDSCNITITRKTNAPKPEAPESK